MQIKEIQEYAQIRTKARAYLDGLLMIPFNIFIKEPIFDKINDLRKNLLVIYNLNIIPHLDVGLHENIASILIYMKHIKPPKLLR